MSPATFVNIVQFSLSLVTAAIIGTDIRAFVVVTHVIWLYCRYEHPLWSATITAYAFIAYCFLIKCSSTTHFHIAVRMAILIGMDLPSPLLPATLPFSQVPLSILRKIDKSCIRSHIHCRNIDGGLGDWEQVSTTRPVSIASETVLYSYPVLKFAVVEDTPIVRNEDENGMVVLIERFAATQLLFILIDLGAMLLRNPTFFGNESSNISRDIYYYLSTCALRTIPLSNNEITMSHHLSKSAYLEDYATQSLL
ncbi:hypothetical protein BDA99DRAFT_544344 [Phascolomyces articulosus]|uniref:Uncharacterized protein n=1 Tax=Phascolomyces articulosus TaxID=60185 RepID=A0AAD5JVD2_9FUNG|nr:hypothetical protein BDA99DRAFT_544344 [Phascolomyces articulosus]